MEFPYKKIPADQLTSSVASGLGKAIGTAPYSSSFDSLSLSSPRASSPAVRARPRSPRADIDNVFHQRPSTASRSPNLFYRARGSRDLEMDVGCGRAVSRPPARQDGVRWRARPATTHAASSPQRTAGGTHPGQKRRYVGPRVEFLIYNGGFCKSMMTYLPTDLRFIVEIDIIFQYVSWCI
jgi:hypothetical protein